MRALNGELLEGVEGPVVHNQRTAFGIYHLRVLEPFPEGSGIGDGRGRRHLVAEALEGLASHRRALRVARDVRGKVPLLDRRRALLQVPEAVELRRDRAAFLATHDFRVGYLPGGIGLHDRAQRAELGRYDVEVLGVGGVAGGQVVVARQALGIQAPGAASHSWRVWAVPALSTSGRLPSFFGCFAIDLLMRET